MKKRLFCVSFIILVLIIASITYFSLYLEEKVALGCLIYDNTGYVCPTCGTSRMIADILKLDFKSAFEHNQVMFVSIPIFGIIIMKNLYFYIKKGKTKLSLAEKCIIFALIFTFAVFTVARNII